MRLRPWPIVILAVIHALGPVGNLFISAWVQNLSPMEFFSVLVATSSIWELIDFFLLLPLAGLAIYLCKIWSYPIFLLVAGLTVYSNTSAFTQWPEQFPSALFAVAVLLDILLVGYFLIPAVRAIYWNPRLRWWESKPRYRVEFPAGFVQEEGSETKGMISDISVGGVFFASAEKIGLGKAGSMRFSGHEVPVRVVYHRTGGSSGQLAGYGVQFLHTRQSKAQIRSLVRSLDREGIHPRDQVDWKRDFKKWVVTLVKTGRGLLPPDIKQGK